MNEIATTETHLAADNETRPNALIDNDRRSLAEVLSARLPGADGAIASGFLDLGALLELDEAWQKANSLRLLFGGESSMRSGRAFAKGVDALKTELDKSIGAARRADPFLTGAEAVVAALRDGHIAARVHRKTRFHAKATLTAGTALQGTIGSSNLTIPGLTTNTELNVDLDDVQARALALWFENLWKDAEDVSDLIVQQIAPHAQLHDPFDVWLKSLRSLLERRGLEPDEWDRTASTMFPKLAGYQRRGYRSVLASAIQWDGAFLCDGVGSGKTFVGLMLIERLVRHEGKRVALFVPKAAKEAVWETEVRNHLRGIDRGYEALKLFSHTDLGREKMRDELDAVREQADVIIIDEAHHFRNRGTKGEGDKRRSRYWEMYDICEGKTVILLTATPINNSLLDFQNMVQLFSRDRVDHFARAPLGIHTLRGHIRELDKRIEDDAFDGSGEELPVDIARDPLFRELVTQRSRADIVASMRSEDGEVRFPDMAPPKVAEYNVTQTYGKLLRMVERAFNKAVPLFTLAIYDPSEYGRTSSSPQSTEEAFERGRRKQVVSLIRTSFLKRFESSAAAFEQSCKALLRKLLAWSQANASTPDQKAAVAAWIDLYGRFVAIDPQGDLFGDDVTDPLLDEDVETFDPAAYDFGRILQVTGQDIVQIGDFLEELERFQPKQDKKLQRLLKLLRDDPVMSRHKAIVFTEYSTTARYLADQLRQAGVQGVEEIDGSSGRVAEVVTRFAPYYNGSSSNNLSEKGKSEIRILIATDVLAEGLNLQDATRLVNYDLHWNPVRLMQRIGRIDRRMNGAVEAKLIADHPDRADQRGKVAYWNFLPPDELDVLLRLYQRVAHKTLRISKTLGIEHGRLLKADDDYDVIQTFEAERMGRRSTVEVLREELKVLLADPATEDRLNGLPDGLRSGRAALEGTANGVFFCYACPAQDAETGEWTQEAGEVVWLLRDRETGQIAEGPEAIAERIRSAREEPRLMEQSRETLLDAKAAVEKHLKKTYLRRVQAPAGVDCDLVAWMELN